MIMIIVKVNESNVAHPVVLHFFENDDLHVHIISLHYTLIPNRQRICAK